MAGDSGLTGWPADHRPWALPQAPWVMAQTWHDLLFAHWPVPVSALRPLIPPRLEIDTFDGEAWIGVVPFRMSGIHPRRLPAAPGFSAFPEINVRTYVTDGERPGVWFFSLDAANRIAVAVARRWYHLPYFHAAMSARRTSDTVRYASRRLGRGSDAATFQASYRPVGPVSLALPGSVEHWLTERYCLYALRPNGDVVQAEVHHRPWPLQPAEVEIEVNTMAEPIGVQLPITQPLLQFSERLDVVVWNPRRIEARGSRLSVLHSG